MPGLRNETGQAHLGKLVVDKARDCGVVLVAHFVGGGADVFIRVVQGDVADFVEVISSDRVGIGVEGEVNEVVVSIAFEGYFRRSRYSGGSDLGCSKCELADIAERLIGGVKLSSLSGSDWISASMRAVRSSRRLRSSAAALSWAS